MNAAEKPYQITGNLPDQAFFLLLVFGGVVFSSFYWHQDWGWVLKDALMSTLAFGIGVLGMNLILYYYPAGKFRSWPALMFSILSGTALVFLCRLIWKADLFGDPSFLVFFDASIPFRLTVAVLLFHLLALQIMSGKTTEKDFQLIQQGEQYQKLTREAELHYLRQQIQPHFLFNSLNSINALLGKQPDKARQMVQGLADFYRENLNKDPQKWESLEKELAVISQYLALEKIRFGHRLAYEIDIPDELKKLKLPSLMVQTLVENAVKHGLYGTTGEIIIRIEARRLKSLLVISVHNPMDDQSLKLAGTGFGLNYLKRRLFLIFGRNDLLDCDQKSGIYSATLKIPLVK
ncbi:Histidine kinase [Cyclobacterium lianum]|uniref:Histidine kinase n=1 Tax=Cyclobacterium lianum TaxID=388280 RepID=A0A1M7NIL6_9BACT|nr:histidine kinase [Cyclobacterium lianum]SHN03739.1 Histidine kinase [Cyclobacterium lianum]